MLCLDRQTGTSTRTNYESTLIVPISGYHFVRADSASAVTVKTHAIIRARRHFLRATAVSTEGAMSGPYSGLENMAIPRSPRPPNRVRVA